MNPMTTTPKPTKVHLQVFVFQTFARGARSIPRNFCGAYGDLA